jgi:hypothetical protein
MDTTQTLKQEGLALLLDSRLQEWELARMPQELKLLECYQDVMRIPRDEDTKGTGAAKSRKAANIFVGSTRNKVRSARAKIIDSLLGNGKMPFDTEPTEEELRDYADVVEDIVTEQLERMDYRTLLKTGTNSLATYGTAFTFGLFVRKESLTETTVDASLGIQKLVENKFEFDFPYFELANTLDVYPDPEARNVKDGLGVFWVTMESKHTVEAWKIDKSYKNINQALLGLGDKGQENGSDRASSIRANVEYWHKNDRVKVARFFGKIPKKYLSEKKDGDADDSGEMIDAIVIMAGGVVVKVNEMPYDRNPTYRCGYEEIEHEMWAVGVAENNMPHQKVSNAAFRLFLEGKGMALLGTKSVDRSAFMPSEDFVKFPGKVYQFKPNLTPEERKTAIIEHIEPDVTGGWIDVIRMSEQFSDDDTGITKYTQGDDSRNLNKTASGISMIMNASSLPIKEVISNIDSNWIEPHVEALIDWNIKYLEVDTVLKIHGEKHAAIWQQVKEFGKTSFMNWQATGTSSFMQKEILTSKLRAFAEFALSNPLTAQKVDIVELLEQTWDVMQIGKESPILKDDGKASLPPEVQQQMQQQQEQIQHAEQAMQELSGQLQSIQQQASKTISDLESKLQDKEYANASDDDKKELEIYKSRTDRLKLAASVAPIQISSIIGQEFGIDIQPENIEQGMQEQSTDTEKDDIEETKQLDIVLGMMQILANKIDMQNKLETVVVYDENGKAIKSVKRLPEEENTAEDADENGVEE